MFALGSPKQLPARPWAKLLDLARNRAKGRVIPLSQQLAHRCARFWSILDRHGDATTVFDKSRSS